jgi:hypothetical protein
MALLLTRVVRDEKVEDGREGGPFGFVRASVFETMRDE